MVDKKVMQSEHAYFQLSFFRELNFQQIINSLFPLLVASQKLVPIPYSERDDFARINHHH